MKQLIATIALAFACTCAMGQKLGEDPYGLTEDGLPKKTAVQPLAAPPSKPADFADCGNGVFVNKTTVLTNNKGTELKLVMVYFSTQGSLTFAWPADLRHWQKVMIVSPNSLNGRNIYPEIDLRETKNNPSIRWDYDQLFVGGSREGFTLGRVIHGTDEERPPLLLHISVSPPTMKCLKDY